MKCLYVVGRESGPVKIGFASDVRKRIMVMQTGCPFPILPLHCFEVDNAPALERACHMFLREKRTNGEWFEITSDEALSAIYAVSKFMRVELDEIDVSAFMPVSKPEPVISTKGNRMGRKPSGKVIITIRLDPDIVSTLKVSGPGWQARANVLLREQLGLV